MKQGRRFRAWVEDEIPVVITRAGRYFKLVVFLFGQYPDRVESLFTMEEVEAIKYYFGDVNPGKRICFKEIIDAGDSKIHLPVETDVYITTFAGNPLGFNLGEIGGLMEVGEEKYPLTKLRISEARA
jgi:hypothetical protein